MSRRIASGGNPFEFEEVKHHDHDPSPSDVLQEVSIETSKVEYNFPNETLFPSIDILASSSVPLNSRKANGVVESAARLPKNEDEHYDLDLVRAQIELARSQEKRISIEIQHLEAQEKRSKWIWKLEGLKMMLDTKDSLIDEDTLKLLKEKYQKLALDLLND
jgi:hypothetical protein